MATMESPDGPIMAGLWGRVNGKSLVWYNKAEFDAAGYEVPETWDELMALQAQIIADGDTPWAVGIESGAATGWAMTDWVEEMMLRTTSLENYDRWVAGDLKFDSPEVRAAIESINELWLADGAVYGGTGAVATTSFGDAPKVMFEQPPKAWLHKQGNFITSFFPENLKAGVDYDFFYLPSKDPSLGTSRAGCRRYLCHVQRPAGSSGNHAAFRHRRFSRRLGESRRSHFSPQRLPAELVHQRG